MDGSVSGHLGDTSSGRRRARECLVAWRFTPQAFAWPDAWFELSSQAASVVDAAGTCGEMEGAFKTVTALAEPHRGISYPAEHGGDRRPGDGFERSTTQP
jgi:hypothetical protein